MTTIKNGPKRASDNFNSKKSTDEAKTPRTSRIHPIKAKSVFDDYDEKLKISDYRTDIIIQEQVDLCPWVSSSTSSFTWSLWFEVEGDQRIARRAEKRVGHMRHNGNIGWKQNKRPKKAIGQQPYILRGIFWWTIVLR